MSSKSEGDQIAEAMSALPSRAAKAAGLLRGAAENGTPINDHGLHGVIVARRTLNQVLALLEGWDFYAETKPEESLS